MRTTYRVLASLFLLLASTACAEDLEPVARGPRAELAGTLHLPVGSTSLPGTLHLSCGVGPLIIDGKRFVADFYGAPGNRPQGYAPDQLGWWTRVSEEQVHFRPDGSTVQIWFRPPASPSVAKPRCDS